MIDQLSGEFLPDEYGNYRDPRDPAPTAPASGAPAAGATPYTFDEAGLARLRQEHPDYSSYVDGLAALGYQPRDIMGLTLGRDNQPQPLANLHLPNSTNGAQTAQQGYGGTGAGGRGDGAFAIDPSFLQAYSGSFQAPGDAALPQFQSPGGFTLPTTADLLKDPSYLFREGRITDQIQNSASMRGITNSGGTLDDIMSSIGNFAGLSYDSLVNRDLGVWGSNWQHALDAYGAQTGRANTVYGRALGEFQDARQQYYDSQDRPFDKLARGATIGQQAALA